jgi:hypothetical protein
MATVHWAMERGNIDLLHQYQCKGRIVLFQPIQVNAIRAQLLLPEQ